MIKELKNKSGITLIALIITIIVMLILVSVTITIAINGGLFEKAGEAREKFDITKEKEQLQFAMVCMQAEFETDLIKRKEIFIDSLENERVNVYINGMGYTVHYLDTNRIYTIDDIGNILEEDSSTIVKDNTLGEFEGTGTLEDPYVIMSIEDLVSLSNKVAKGSEYRGKYFKLGRTLDFQSELSYCSLDKKYKFYEETLCYEEGSSDDATLLELMTSGRGFIPIGKKGAFYANFDGGNENGYEIRNLYEEIDSIAGLFGTLYGNINNLTIKGKIICKGDNAGGIVGRIYNGSVNNCESYVEINSQGQYVGGISGRYGKITNCKNYGEIKCNNSKFVGGIVGQGGARGSQNYGKITGKATLVGGICGSGLDATNTECLNYGNIEITGSEIGGISGIYSNNSMCVNYGNISAIGDGAGGITGGRNNNKKIIKCKNYGNITGTSNVGGISAFGFISIVNCINFGNIYATSNTAGGILGYNNTHSQVIGSCNLGDVKSINGLVGGLVGNTYTYYNLNITCCYNAGKIISEKTSKGGLVGRVDGNTPLKIDCSYWTDEPGLSSISNTNSKLSITNSKSLTTSDMKKTEKDTNEEYTFLELLNKYVDEYNLIEENTDKLVHWIYDEKTGYPIPNINEE